MARYPCSGAAAAAVCAIMLATWSCVPAQAAETLAQQVRSAFKAVKRKLGAPSLHKGNHRCLSAG
jgi:hypothetical protein